MKFPIKKLLLNRLARGNITRQHASRVVLEVFEAWRVLGELLDDTPLFIYHDRSIEHLFLGGIICCRGSEVVKTRRFVCWTATQFSLGGIHTCFV